MWGGGANPAGKRNSRSPKPLAVVSPSALNVISAPREPDRLAFLSGENIRLIAV
jgi:hypothetical protein